MSVCTRSTWAGASADPLGRARPAANSRSASPRRNARAPANTGCWCMGFHSGRLSTSAAVSMAESSSGFHSAATESTRIAVSQQLSSASHSLWKIFTPSMSAKSSTVALSQPPAAREHLLQPLQLREAKGGQNVAQPIVVSDLGVFVVCNRLPRLRAEISNPLGQPLIVREQCPATAGGDHLVAVETQDRGGAE